MVTLTWLKGTGFIVVHTDAAVEDEIWEFLRSLRKSYEELAMKAKIKRVPNLSGLQAFEHVWALAGPVVSLVVLMDKDPHLRMYILLYMHTCSIAPCMHTCSLRMYILLYVHCNTLNTCLCLVAFLPLQCNAST